MEGVTHENWGWLTLKQGCFYPKTRHEIGVGTGGFCVKLEFQEKCEHFYTTEIHNDTQNVNVWTCEHHFFSVSGGFGVVYKGVVESNVFIIYYTRVRTEIFCIVHTLTR